MSCDHIIAQNCNISLVGFSCLMAHLSRLVVAGHLMVLEVEAPVHVVNRVRDLILVSHHSQIEGLKHLKLTPRLSLKEKSSP